MAPALWNGFPLLQWDTGGYLARWYEGYLVPSRAVVYGLILNAGAPLAFWPVLLLQSALTVWILALMLRAHGLRPTAPAPARRHRRAVGPHHAALADLDPAHRYFLGLGVLALYLLLLRNETLGRGERVGSDRADRGRRRHA